MNLFQNFISESPTFGEIALILGVTIAMSVLFAFLYTKVRSLNGYHRDMPISFILIPVIICGLMVAVTSISYAFTGTVQTARYARFAMGAIAAVLIIKFRSQQRDYEDLTYMFFVTGIGLVMGMGFLYFALLLYAVVLIIIILLYVFKFPRVDQKRLSLKITIPESLNYEEAFNDIFEKYTSKCQLIYVKSTDLGTLFNLGYEIVIKDEKLKKEFLDEIRTRNGNLNVVLTVKQFENNGK